MVNLFDSKNVSFTVSFMTLFFLRILNKLKLLKCLSINVRVKIYGATFSLPIIKGIGLKNMRTTEPWMLQVIKNLIQISENNTFVDVGVNIGQTLLKVKSINRNINYVGFEPNPSALFYTNELIKQNNLQNNTSIFPVGLNKSTELLTLKIYNKSDVDSSASILEEFRPNEKVIDKKNIAVFNINDHNIAKDSISDMNILKIDVEGAELEVLNSLSEIINKSKPFILIEILPVYKESNTYRISRQQEIEKLLVELNYEIKRIIKPNNNSTLIQFEEISEFGIHSDIKKCDYILVPKSRVEKFKSKMKNEK